MGDLVWHIDMEGEADGYVIVGERKSSDTLDESLIEAITNRSLKPLLSLVRLQHQSFFDWTFNATSAVPFSLSRRHRPLRDLANPKAHHPTTFTTPRFTALLFASLSREGFNRP